MTEQEEKIQIVAFSTNDSNMLPNDFVNIFLEQQVHSILKKSKHAIAFTTTLPNKTKPNRIMVCSVLNLTREYVGITDVNCYILIIDLEKEDSKEKFESILEYSKDYCDLSKKFYVLGITSGNEDTPQNITKSEIIRTIELTKLNFEYKEMCFKNTKDISDTILEIFTYSSKHSINNEKESEKNAKEAGSCAIF